MRKYSSDDIDDIVYKLHRVSTVAALAAIEVSRSARRDSELDMQGAFIRSDLQATSDIALRQLLQDIEWLRYMLPEPQPQAQPQAQ